MLSCKIPALPGPRRRTARKHVTKRNRMRLKTMNRNGVLVLLLCLPLLASDGGSLSGTVTDPGAGAVPGAQVTTTETSTAASQTIRTDGRGFYSFQSLPVGSYDVEVTATGFKPLRRTRVVINVDSKVVVDA